MVLVWGSKCNHTTQTGTAACWIIPMASPVVSAGSKTVANLMTHAADLDKNLFLFRGMSAPIPELQQIAGSGVERGAGEHGLKQE